MGIEEEKALVEIKEKHRMQLQSTISCVETFLENREFCGVKTDESFIKWLKTKLTDDKRKGEKLFAEHEKRFP